MRLGVSIGTLFLVGLLAGCGGGGSSGFGDGGGNRDDGGPTDDSGDPVFPDLDGGTDVIAPCTGLKCQQVNCGGGSSTTVSGTVYMPNGTLPLYNAIVYVPNAPVDPIANGATCDKCGSTVSGPPIVTALTDHQGKFLLKDVPVGTNIPLVVQIGKWRRQFVLPQVSQCVDNPVAGNMLRLPRNRNEGDMPKIAVTTGGCDPLACILPKIGIDASEYGVNSSGAQKVTMYAGGGGSGPPGITPAQNLWGNVNELKKFDLAIFSCECSENNGNKTNPQAVQQYVDGGGRIFTSHYHYTWFKNLIPAWQSTASWGSAFSSTPDLIDTTFPKGKALADWLKYVEPSLTYGQMPLNEKTYDVGGVNAPTTRWVYSNNGGNTTHYLSFNTPVGAMPDNQCGKAVYGGMHISSGGGSVGTNFPSGCSSTLSAQEKALAFLFFDLSSCIQKDTDPPMPPQPK
jgi:hypothetical protein